MCNTLRVLDFFASLHLTFFERPAEKEFFNRLVGGGGGQDASGSEAAAQPQQATEKGTEAASGGSGGSGSEAPGGTAASRQGTPAPARPAAPGGDHNAARPGEDARAETARQVTEARRHWAKWQEGTSIDLGAVDALEGGGKTSGVPSKRGKDKKKVVIGQSGVTIGRGLDLGQHNEQDLRKYRLPEALHQKLVPGLGVKGNAAIEFVAKNKIVLTDEEEAILAEALHARTTQRARDGFASSPHNTQRVKFEELPPYVQTVVYSMTMNMGEDAFVTPKITMRAIASGDYQAAANELLEGNWKAPLPRRRSEGRYLKEQLQKNGLWIGR